MQFEFAVPRIVFGCGSAAGISGAVRQFGSRPLLVTGNSQRAAALVPDAAALARVGNEPGVDTVRTLVAVARREQCDAVVAIGGGSVMDAGKAAAAILANGGDPLDYLEVIGKGQSLHRPSIPFIAVPTTAGTGTEVTRNAVLGSPEHGVKASLRSPLILARLAVVDPELTFDLPPALTASTGMDALTQLIEPFVSNRANPMTDPYCLEGIARVARSLRPAFRGDRAARTDMSLASLLGGVALANAGLGAVHGFAAPIGGGFSAPHGAVCAALLPHVTRANLEALSARAPESEALARYRRISEFLTGEAAGSALTGWLEDLCADLEIPPLRAYGITAAGVPALVANAAKASSMKANPIVLTAGELTAILLRAI
ncbi:MAG: iron-containing alcohol dehydrogenase [Bryobacteraceae bacterium]|nr:iron-containing alcohol dehydrogenase [Bryobacteraceae bacterium]